MVKLLTIFNLLAGAASIAGLYVTLNLGYVPYMLMVTFGLSLGLSGYVLFVPGTRIERNVSSKVRRFALPGYPDELVIQSGEFSLTGFGLAVVRFDQPFAETPTVEVVNEKNNRGYAPVVKEVTPHQVIFHRDAMSAPAEGQTFTWVAR